jgi:hypothetical protein
LEIEPLIKEYELRAGKMAELDARDLRYWEIQQKLSSAKQEILSEQYMNKLCAMLPFIFRPYGEVTLHEIFITT